MCWRILNIGHGLRALHQNKVAPLQSRTLTTGFYEDKVLTRFLPFLATHIFLDKSIVSLHDKTLFKSSNIHSIKLNYAHELAFSLPFDLHPHRTESENDLLSHLFGTKSRYVFGENLLKFVLQPQKQAGLDYGLSRELTEVDIYKQVKTNLSLDASLNEQLNEARATSYYHSIDTPGQKDNANERFPWNGTAEIVFLGTVSSASNPVRSESSIYIDIPAYGGILLDVGGGTYQQMVLSSTRTSHSTHTRERERERESICG